MNKIIVILVVIGALIWGGLGWLYWLGGEGSGSSSARSMPKSEARVCEVGFYLFKKDFIGVDKIRLHDCRFHKVNSHLGSDLYRGWVQYTSPLSERRLMAFMMVAYDSQEGGVGLCSSKMAFDANENIQVDSQLGICSGSRQYLVDYPSK